MFFAFCFDFVFVTAYHSLLSVCAVCLEIVKSFSLVVFVFLMCLFTFLWDWFLESGGSCRVIAGRSHWDRYLDECRGSGRHQKCPLGHSIHVCTCTPRGLRTVRMPRKGLAPSGRAVSSGLAWACCLPAY